MLWRIHGVSVLLVVPQVVVWTFTLVWLMADRGWSAASAGALVTAAQLLGAVGRVLRRRVVRPGRVAAASGPHHRSSGRRSPVLASRTLIAAIGRR